MCFNKELSLFFSMTSLGIALWAMTGTSLWRYMPKWRLHRIAMCFAYFCFMELLQFIQYNVIDDCDNPLNTYSTALGYLHICFQPFFTNLIMSALDRQNLDRKRENEWRFIFKTCLIVGLFMSCRIIIPAIVSPHALQTFFHPCYREMDTLCAEKENWKTCSTTGVYHIRWNFKMIRSSYLFPNIGLHFVSMFVVPFAMGLHFESLLLLASGPLLAVFFRVDDGERSTIWCFFSVMEEIVTFGSQILSIHLSKKKGDEEMEEDIVAAKGKRVRNSKVAVDHEK